MQPRVRSLPRLSQLLPPRLVRGRRLDHARLGLHTARAVGPRTQPAVEQGQGAVEQTALRLSQLRLAQGWA